MVKKSFNVAAPAVASPSAPETAPPSEPPPERGPSDLIGAGIAEVAIDPSDGGAVPTIYRLQKRWQFLACAKGRSLARGGVAIQALPRADHDPRIGVGFTATRKIGGAVQRNRAKRRLREAARQLLPLHGAPSHDYVFVARGGTIDRDWLRLLEDVRAALIGLAAGADEPAGARTSRSKGSRSKPNPAKPSAPRPPPASAPPGKVTFDG